MNQEALMHRIRPRILLPIVLMGLLAAIVLWPTPVGAQCGTQASSCKNCHEVQAKAPVNTKGDWHVQHAFGDFCEFCHAGNVTAVDKTAAHQGLVYPLSDTQANCSSCHAKDYQDKAGIYAVALGVDLNNPPAAPSGGGATSTGGQAPAPSGGQNPAPAQPAAQPQAPANPPAAPVGESASPNDEPETKPEAVNTAGGQILDLNQNRPAADAPASPIVPLPSSGDLILIGLLVVLLTAFAILIWRFEGLGLRWAELRGKSLQPAFASSGATLQGSPALEALRPSLEQANPATLAALSRLLETDPVRGGQMIEALARINPRLVEAVRRLSDSDLELLVALVRDLKARE
jgi:hypothetical protein